MIPQHPIDSLPSIIPNNGPDVLVDPNIYALRSEARPTTTRTSPTGNEQLTGSSLDDTSDAMDSGSNDNFYQGFTIDMKEAVGNMSISPASRDLVLAARKGLFIIDLEHPRETPRFLPQGGTWEVADVQWNPHPSRSELIVSTSSQKLLIWNLALKGSTSVEHILHAHYRAITDINWHGHYDNVVASCGLDSWIWVWDLRVGKDKKNVNGFCAWNDGATQVKWNRQNPHILASAHSDSLLIWDDRKGSLPLLNIPAHDAKIYGIDWSRVSADEIVTCSLDKTIKFWDIAALESKQDSFAKGGGYMHLPTKEIPTTYPVWRARHLPFGHGVLSLPQRGKNTLEMYRDDQLDDPIMRFEGHTGVVKEYVWRVKGGQDLEHDDRDFQLVTLANDRTVRLWPVAALTQEKAGFVRGSPIQVRMPRHGATNITYRTLPEERELGLDISSPTVGQEDSAALARKRRGSSASAIQEASAASMAARTGGYMTLGPAGGKSTRQGLDLMSWYSFIQLPPRSGSKSASGNGLPSAATSRVTSRSRISVTNSPAAQTRSASNSRDDEDDLEEQPGDLAGEISSVVRKLSGKVKYEQVDLTKKRRCTFTLYGPWGESGNVFIRVIFSNFPNNYPPKHLKKATPPSVEIERTTAISLKTRALLLKKLRNILSSNKLVLEKCLLFLLGLYERPRFDSDSDEEVTPVDGEYPIPILSSNQSVPRGRDCQGVFGPNGQLVFFSKAKSVHVRSAPSPSPSINDGRTLSPSTTLSDALQMLSVLATDQTPVYTKRNDAMSFMDAFIPRMRSRTREPGFSVESPRYAPRPRAMLAIHNLSAIDVLDRNLGVNYTVLADNPMVLCSENAVVAAKHGRFDHERVWSTLHALLAPLTLSGAKPKPIPTTGKTEKSSIPAAAAYVPKMWDRIIGELFREFELRKDLQMLAMLSVLLMHVDRNLVTLGAREAAPIAKSPESPLHHRSNIDYFTLRPRAPEPRTVTTGNQWPTLASVTPRSPVSVSNQSVSSGKTSSWTSFLPGAASYRHLLSGGLDLQTSNSKRDMPVVSETSRLNTTNDSATLPPPVAAPTASVAIAGSDSLRRRSLLPYGLTNTDPESPSKSRSDPVVAGGIQVNTSFTQGYRRRMSLVVPPRLQTSPASLQKRPTVVVGMSNWAKQQEPPLQRMANSPLILQREMHIRAYAEVLMRWQLAIKRVEILKNIRIWGIDLEENLVAVSTCTACGLEAHGPASKCPSKRPSTPPRQVIKQRCTVCRLPVSGLTHACFTCLHITHISCWQSRPPSLGNTCPSGCGCDCKASDTAVPPTPAPLSPMDIITMSPEAKTSRVHSPETRRANNGRSRRPS